MDNINYIKDYNKNKILLYLNQADKYQNYFCMIRISEIACLEEI